MALDFASSNNQLAENPHLTLDARVALLKIKFPNSKLSRQVLGKYFKARKVRKKLVIIGKHHKFYSLFEK